MAAAHKARDEEPRAVEALQIPKVLVEQQVRERQARRRLAADQAIVQSLPVVLHNLDKAIKEDFLSQ